MFPQHANEERNIAEAYKTDNNYGKNKVTSKKTGKTIVIVPIQYFLFW